MAENEFNDLVDCKFPYNDPVRAHALILQACELSLNCVFMVVYEICVPPASAQLSRQTQIELTRQLEVALEHPLKPQLIQVMLSHIDEKLDQIKTQRLLDEVNLLGSFTGKVVLEGFLDRMSE